jgi:hypothetical protein
MNSNLLRLLPYGGALPFLVGAMFLLLGITQVPNLGRTDAMVLAYGLTIVSFIAGIHWGQHVSGVRTRVNLLVSSNVVALAAWVGFLLLPKFFFCLLLIVLFIVLLSIDGHLRDQGQIDVNYASTRRNVTAIAGICLLVTALA